jgi:hypothetical protein
MFKENYWIFSLSTYAAYRMEEAIEIWILTRKFICTNTVSIFIYSLR